MLQHTPRISICTYRLQSNTSPKIHKEQFYTIRVHSLLSQVQYRWVQTSLTSLGLTKVVLNRNAKFIEFTCSPEARLRKRLTKVMMPCSRTSIQPPRPTLPPHSDQRGRSGQTPLLAHLQLGLESNLSTKGTRKTYAITYIRIMQ